MSSTRAFAACAALPQPFAPQHVQIADDNMGSFVSAWVGYIAALVLTVIIMIMYNHAQPALLYLVPANIGCR